MSAASAEASVIVRAMGEDDLPAVWALEKGAYQYPWSQTIFRDCLRVGYCCRVAEQGGVLHGYSIMSVAVGEAHLLNLCVGVDSRARGYGRKLLDKVIGEAALLNATRLFLEVRPTNHAARGLYDSLGFRTIGRRTAYYKAPQGREDALVLALDLGPAEPDAASRDPHDPR
ncbi:MAG: ribosomal protein S18-alanine N-acetyltransferase [Pseudomonadota bacterium]